MGVDSLARYASFEMTDTLPTELDYQGARLIQIRDDTQTDLTDTCGTLSFDETTRTVLFTFDADWLAHDMPLAGETYRLRVDTVVNQQATCGSPIVNRAASTVNGRVQTTQAHVDAREPDPVLKTALPADGMTVRPGETIAYTLSYTNTTDAVQDVVLCDDIPAHTSYQPGSLAADANAPQPDALEEPHSEANGQPEPASISVHWSALEPGQSAQARFSVVVDSPNPRILEIVNAGFASVNNAAKVRTNQVRHLVSPSEPCITVEKAAVPTSGARVAPGEVVTYTLTVTNAGAAPLAPPARNIRIRDAIPAATAYVEKSASPEFDGAYDAEANALSWLIPSLAPGKSVELSFAVAIADDAPDGETIANAARYHANWTPETPSALESETNQVEHVVERIETPAPSDGGNDAPDAPHAPAGKPFAQTGDASGSVMAGGVLLGCSSLIAVSLLLAHRQSRRNIRRARRMR